MIQTSHINLAIATENKKIREGDMQSILTLIDPFHPSKDIAMLLPDYDYNEQALNAITSSPTHNRPTVYAGLFLTDPFLDLPHYLDQLAKKGIHKITNFPTVGLYGKDFLLRLKEVGYGVEEELNKLEKAQKLGFDILPCVPGNIDSCTLSAFNDKCKPDTWLIHQGIPKNKRSNIPYPPLSDALLSVKGKKFLYQPPETESIVLPKGVDGLAMADWWLS